MNNKLLLIVAALLVGLFLISSQKSETFHIVPENSWDPNIGVTPEQYLPPDQRSIGNKTPVVYPGPWNIPTVYQENPINVCGGLY